MMTKFSFWEKTQVLNTSRVLILLDLDRNQCFTNGKGYFHSTRLIQARRMGLLRFRQKRALCGRVLAELPCFLLLAYCCRFFWASEPTGTTEDTGTEAAGGAAGVAAGGAGPLALMVRAWT